MPENMPSVTDLPELPTPADLERAAREFIEVARALGCEINPAEGMNAGGEAVQPERR